MTGRSYNVTVHVEGQPLGKNVETLSMSSALREVADMMDLLNLPEPSAIQIIPNEESEVK